MVRRKTLLGVVLAAMAVLALALPAAANVIPENPQVGSTALTRMRCYVGTVSFTITGNGVSIPVGTTVADPDGWARLNFTVPDVAPGTYNMQGRGTGCDGELHVVNVTFVIRARGGGNPPEYPPRNCDLGINRGEMEPNDQAVVITKCFRGVVIFTVNGQEVGRDTANPGGVAQIRFRVPNLPDGDYQVAASGTGEDGQPLVLSISLRIQRLVAGTPGGTTDNTPAPGAIIPATPIVPNTGTGADVVVNTPAVQAEVPTQVLGAVETAVAANATVATAGTRNQALVRTGSDAGSLVRIALIVLAVGSVLVVGTRRRSARA
jgi:hypothetical protein